MDDSDLDLIGVLKSVSPQGPGLADDSALIVTGTIQGVDVDRRRVTIRARGGSVTLPAIAGRYKVGGLARVLMDPTAGRPTHVLGAVDARDPVVVAEVTVVTSSTALKVKVDGSSYDVAAIPGSYSVGASAWVQLNDWGLPVLAHGPSSATPSAGGGGGSGGSGPGVVTSYATIGPQSSGTWRSGYGWDAWGNDIHGGVADIYQGSAYGSGTLIGLACYGDQLVNLGAIGIQKITLTARRNGSGTGSVPLTVQGSPHAQRPGGSPSLVSASSASTGGLSTGATGSVDLPADLCEAFRTGAAKSLAAVGAAYAGFGGTSTPGSFTLAVQYTRYA